MFARIDIRCKGRLVHLILNGMIVRPVLFRLNLRDLLSLLFRERRHTLPTSGHMRLDYRPEYIALAIGKDVFQLPTGALHGYDFIRDVSE